MPRYGGIEPPERTPAERFLATAASTGHVYLWNAESGAFLRELDVGTDHTWAETFSANGDMIATANDDDSVRLWWRGTGSHVAKLTGHQGRCAPFPSPRTAPPSPPAATTDAWCGSGAPGTPDRSWRTVRRVTATTVRRSSRPL